jgi:hypothetical protein
LTFRNVCNYMRRCFFIVLLLYSSTGFSQIGDYFGNEAAWRYDYWCSGLPACPTASGGEEWEMNEFYISGTLVLGPYTYYQLRRRWILHYIGTGAPSAYGDEHVMYVRQEDRSIFYFDEGLGLDSLFIKYPENEGEIFTGKFAAISSGTIEAEDIDSILVGSAYRYRYYTDLSAGPSGPNIIEGIGYLVSGSSSEGRWFGEAYVPSYGIGFEHALNCYFEYGDKKWGTISIGWGCQYGIGLEEQSPDLGLNVYPNPARDELSLSGGNLNIEQLEILSLDGKLILLHQIGSAQQQSVNIQMLEPGQYALRITLSDERVRVLRFQKI